MDAGLPTAKAGPDPRSETLPEDAVQALAAMRRSQARLVEAASCPPARHLAFAGMMGTLTASQAAPTWGVFVIEALVLVGVALVIRWDRRRTGMFINGYRAGPTRKVTLALMAFTLPMFLLGAWLKHAKGWVWAPLALGVVVTVVAYFGSSAWMRVYRRELGVEA